MEVANVEDAKIIELYFKRDPDAIAETERSYGRQLQRLAEGIMKNYEDGQECVSDTYMKAWETIPPQKPNYFYAYLAKICRYFAFGRLDWKQAQKRQAEVVVLTEEMELCIPDNSQEREAEGKAIGRAITAFLGTMTLENRLLFMRRYWYCESIAEIAQRYRISESKVKTRLHRIRKQLKVHLEREGICV